MIRRRLRNRLARPEAECSEAPVLPLSDGDEPFGPHRPALIDALTGLLLAEELIRYWTINAIGPAGDLAVTRIDEHGSVTLPHTYVAEHVQSG